MAFFKKDLEETAAEAALTPPGEVRSPSAAPARTYVAPGSHIDGSIAGDAEVLVDGSLTGNVELKGRFVLGRRGRIEAERGCPVRSGFGPREGRYPGIGEDRSAVLGLGRG